MQPSFIFKDLFFEKVGKTGGMVNCHAHLDRAYTLTPEIWEQAEALMEEKWVLMRDIKKKHTEESLIARMSSALDFMIEQGVVACRTHVDADSVVGMKVVDAASKVRAMYAEKGFTLQLVAHPLEGFLDSDGTDFDRAKMDLFERACSACDTVGGLPSRDRALHGGDRKHAEFLFSTAKNLGKDVDAHIDQENNPEERDSEWFCDMAAAAGMHGRVTLVHAISVAAQHTADRARIYKKMHDLGANVTCCPRAAIGMKQHREKLGPIHNSIAQVDELLAARVNVSLGTDNISDIFIPNSNGDMFDEVNLLADAVRVYNLDTLVRVATENGARTMKLDWTNI